MQKRFINFIKQVLLSANAKERIKNQFLKRAEMEHITRDEDPVSHFCVYFAPYDPKEKQVFMGLHKKSGLWLFNGGHIDKGELPDETVRREMQEELGFVLPKIGNPVLLTIAPIENPKILCRTHFDIWYFVLTDKRTFFPKAKLLEKEFYMNEWLTIAEALEKVTEENTIAAITLLERNITERSQ